MACEFCTGPNGLPCFPQYGIAPHLHGTGPEFPIGTFFKPREFWPSNFQEDPENPNHGTYWCPECGDGKPKNEPEKSSDMEIDLNELERLAKAATRGPWKVVETKVPHYRGGKHTERRIFTANDDPQLKAPYPIVNMSFGLPENEGGAAVKLVSIFEENADYIAAANPSVVLELVRRLRQSEMDAERYRKLRDENAWGEDVALGSGSAWEMLGELHGSNFDMFVDARFQVTKGRES